MVVGFSIGLLVVAVIAGVLALMTIRFNAAMNLVADEAIKLVKDGEGRRQRAIDYVRRVVNSGVNYSYKDCRDLQREIDLRLGLYWYDVRFYGKQQQAIQKKVKDLAEEKAGTMSEDEVIALHNGLVGATARVEKDKKSFQNLRNAASMIGLRTWQQGDFYILVDYSEGSVR